MARIKTSFTLNSFFIQSSYVTKESDVLFLSLWTIECQLYPTKMGLQAKARKYRMGMKKWRWTSWTFSWRWLWGLRFKQERNSLEKTTIVQILIDRAWKRGSTWKKPSAPKPFRFRTNLEKGEDVIELNKTDV